MKVLELFCGTKSISKAFEKRGHETLTVDNDAQHYPDLCMDILKMEIDDLPKEWRKPDVVWASPPCTTFSVASLYRYWHNGRPKTWKTYLGLSLASKAFEPIEQLKPKFWFIENPRGMLRTQHFTQRHHRKTLTYCQYGAKVQKPTDIWTSCGFWIPKRMCSPGDSCHEKAMRGSKNGTQSIVRNDFYDLRAPQKRAIIPEQLAQEIVDVCEGKQEVKQTILMEATQ